MSRPLKVAFATLAAAGLLSATVATLLLWKLVADPAGLVEWIGRLTGP